MSCWMRRKCEGNKDPGCNGWAREIATQNTSTIEHRNEEKRTKLMAYGMKRVLGVIVKKLSLVQQLHILKGYIQSHTQPELKK